MVRQKESNATWFARLLQRCRAADTHHHRGCLISFTPLSFSSYLHSDLWSNHGIMQRVTLWGRRDDYLIHSILSGSKTRSAPKRTFWISQSLVKYFRQQNFHSTLSIHLRRKTVRALLRNYTPKLKSVVICPVYFALKRSFSVFPLTKV